MRLAIISDIHANLEALQSTLDDIEKQRADQTICLGDVVGYGANPNECVSLIQNRCTLTILGNHDAAALGMLSTQNFNIPARIAIEWTADHLDENARTFLKNLPLKENFSEVSFVHATPYEPDMWHYISSLEEAAYNFQFFKTDFCFIGHTHTPIIIVVNAEKELYIHQGTQLSYNALKNARFLVNVGSVGQPRDRDPKACYGILDLDAKTFSYRRVKYDIERCQAKMKKIQMPEFLVTRLTEGR
jgi:predicted phosphodiesterase